MRTWERDCEASFEEDNEAFLTSSNATIHAVVKSM